MIIVTTSHKPSQRTRSFAKDLASILPGAKVVTRGKKTLKDLSVIGYGLKAKHILVINEKHGNPSLIKIFYIDSTTKYPTLIHKYSIMLKGVALSRENPNAIKTYGAEKYRVSYDLCGSERCFSLADIFTELLFNCIDNDDYDIEIVLKDTTNLTIIEFVNAYKKVCGPVIKVSKVKKVDRRI